MVVTTTNGNAVRSTNCRCAGGTERCGQIYSCPARAQGSPWSCRVPECRSDRPWLITVRSRRSCACCQRGHATADGHIGCPGNLLWTRNNFGRTVVGPKNPGTRHTLAENSTGVQPMRKQKNGSKGREPSLANITKALNLAAQDAVETHRQSGLPLAVWKDGKTVLISPDSVEPAKKATARKRRSKS